MMGSVNIMRGSADDGIVAARRYVRREVAMEVMTKAIKEIEFFAKGYQNYELYKLVV